MTTMTQNTNTSPVAIAIRITLTVLKWFGLVCAWTVQYGAWIWFVSIPLWLLRKGGKIVLILLVLSVVGWPVVIVYLIMRGSPEPRHHRSMWRPWFI